MISEQFFKILSPLIAKIILLDDFYKIDSSHKEQDLQGILFNPCYPVEFLRIKGQIAIFTIILNSIL